MPHATVEWTENLEGEFDRAAMLQLIADELRERGEGMFPVGGIRVRAIKISEYVVADGTDPRAAFININFKIAAGRPADFRQRFFDQLFEALKLQLGDLFTRRRLALSLYVEEVADGWKHNTVHKRG